MLIGLKIQKPPKSNNNNNIIIIIIMIMIYDDDDDDDDINNTFSSKLVVVMKILVTDMYLWVLADKIIENSHIIFFSKLCSNSKV